VLLAGGGQFRRLVGIGTEEIKRFEKQEKAQIFFKQKQNPTKSNIKNYTTCSIALAKNKQII